VVNTKTGQKTLALARWAQVHWASKPVLIHPLTGEQFPLPGGLSETDIADIKQRSFDHFSSLLVKLGAQGDAPQDLRKVLMAYWRFGPELIETEDFGKLGELWRLLPADTRIPDHSIWDHLDLVSAFAGAFADDPKGEAALLTLSIGPVQSFIAASRTTSDLWAGSHLLARLSWEAMKPVCESLGPDAILFPRLRGIPQVDLWLRDEIGLPAELFKQCSWMKGGTDANPLFSAAIPNRFVAVVPASGAKQLAEEVTRRVRGWLADHLVQKVVDRLLDEAEVKVEGEQYCHRQMREQLDGFPEVHWAVVPFSLIGVSNEQHQTGLDVSNLSAAMAPFFGTNPGEPCGFLNTPAWKVLGKDMNWGDGTTFFAPNPGVLYPAIHDLAERALAAAKTVRTFNQSTQKGWRCSLTGESEWLTTDEGQLAIPAGKRRSSKDKKFRESEHHETLWTRIADKRPAWAKKGEHLGALPAIKRLWPTLFAEEVREATKKPMDRFVVSTHTMTLASQLDRWLQHGGLTAEGFAEACAGTESVALPRKLVESHANNPALATAKRIPPLLDAARESEDDREYARAQKLVRATLAKGESTKDEIRLETYYALLMMDGDHMGKILAGDEKTAIPYRESFHPEVQRGFDEHAARQLHIKGYGGQKRPVSPNRHLAISAALNDFSQTVVRHVVETEHLGRLIYAGGDDVLAMLPVADLLPAMRRLRHAYSGHDPAQESGIHGGLTLHNGFAAIKKRGSLQVMRMMGGLATASCGAVIAHHQAPLAAVMRELRAAEKRAKSEGARNAFSITVIKRSGGTLHLTEKWGEPVTLLADLRSFLATPGVSRRAVYHSVEWLTDLPDPKDSPEMLATLLAYQFARQVNAKDKRTKEELKSEASRLAGRLAKLAAAQTRDGLTWLGKFLTVAEFLARETRTGGDA